MRLSLKSFTGVADPRGMKRVWVLLSCPPTLPTVDPSTSPGFPIRLAGVGELHAAVLNESRIPGHWWRRVVGKPGFGRDDKGEGGASIRNQLLVERTGSLHFGRDDKGEDGASIRNQLLVERTADPSTSVGMTKGRAELRPESDAG
jgi:hypothetical protein